MPVETIEKEERLDLLDKYRVLVLTPIRECVLSCLFRAFVMEMQVVILSHLSADKRHGKSMTLGQVVKAIIPIHS
jgi:hypothetical protein